MKNSLGKSVSLIVRVFSFLVKVIVNFAIQKKIDQPEMFELSNKLRKKAAYRSLQQGLMTWAHTQVTENTCLGRRPDLIHSG